MAKTSALSKRRQAGIYLLAGFFSLAVFDLFGLEEASRLQIQDGVSRVLADDYPTKPPLAAPGVTPAIAVVLWDDTDLGARQTIWPIPFAQHASVLERIADAKPKAILIDILFKDRREGKTAIDGLRAALTTLRKNGVKTYLLNDGGCDDAGVLPELLTGDDGKVSVTTVPAPRKDDVADGITREYVTFVDRTAVHTPEHLRRECSTAALRLYLDHMAKPDVPLSDFWAPMVLRWGTCRPATGFFPRVGRALHWFVGGHERQPSTCLPFEVVHPGDLAALSAADLEAKFAGKFVVYGTDFLGASDAVRTSIHEETVPGAMLHAMALDNLRVDHAHYVHRGPNTVIGSRELRLTWIDLIMLGAGALFLPWVRVGLDKLVEALAAGAPANPHIAKAWSLIALGITWVFHVLTPFVLAASIGWVAYHGWSIAPVNFAAHVFVWIFVAEVLEIRERIDHAQRRST